MRLANPNLKVPQGASIARRFAKAYSVVLLARNSSSFEPIVKEINAGGGRAVGISTDLTNPTSVRSALDQISQTHSTSALAAAVFNVGGNFFRKSFLDLTENEFTSSYENQLSVSHSPAWEVAHKCCKCHG